MSLTSHLDDAASPICQFLRDRFPNTRRVARECRPQLAGISTLRPADDASYPWGLIGTALDYRLRYYLAVTPVKRLVAAEGAKVAIGFGVSQNAVSNFFRSLEQALRKISPVARKLKRPREELLARYCVTLGLFEEFFRAPLPSLVRSRLLVPRPKRRLSQLLAIPEPHWIDDLCKLSWQFYKLYARDLRHSGAVLNPTFDGSPDVGGADAEFVVGRCLIEVKATVQRKWPWADWLRQLAGYVLLDYSDRYRFNEVGLYLARQGVLIRWPLNDFLGALAGRPVRSLTALRASFRKTARVARQ